MQERQAQYTCPVSFFCSSIILKRLSEIPAHSLCAHSLHRVQSTQNCDPVQFLPHPKHGSLSFGAIPNCLHRLHSFAGPSATAGGPAQLLTVCYRRWSGSLIAVCYRGWSSGICRLLPQMVRPSARCLLPQMVQRLGCLLPQMVQLGRISACYRTWCGYCGAVCSACSGSAGRLLAAWWFAVYYRRWSGVWPAICYRRWYNGPLILLAPSASRLLAPRVPQEPRLLWSNLCKVYRQYLCYEPISLAYCLLFITC